VSAAGNGAVASRPISSISGAPEFEAVSAVAGDPADGVAGAASPVWADETAAPDSAAGGGAGETDGPAG
jgi:hypothetical protein